MKLIWATRGRTWGFRFLLDGGLPDPLEEYEAAFTGAESGSPVCQRTSRRIALRFDDPLGRTDASGRVIPHDLVLLPPLDARVTSVEEGTRLLWPVISEAYSLLWNQPAAPSPADVELAFKRAGSDRQSP